MKPYDRSLLARAQAQTVARVIGIDETDAQVIRVATSALIAFPAAGRLIRLDTHKADSARQASVANVLEHRGVPAMRLVEPAVYPVADTAFATVWELLEVGPEQPTARDVGALCRTLHEATRGIQEGVPTIDPCRTARLEFNASMTLWPERRTDIESLLARCDTLSIAWERACHEMLVLAHGDLHIDNVLLTPDGPKLIDLENAGMAPAGWDLVPGLIAVRRYGRDPASYATFCDAYGVDVEHDPNVDMLCSLYELCMTSWALMHSDVSPAFRDEAQVRLDSMLGLHTRPWVIL